MYKVAVDDDKKAVLSAINIIITSHEMLWFLCGAYSRVLLCEDVLKIPAGRATYDLDVAICVKSLEKFKKFRNSLCSNDIFIQNSKMEHRFTYHSSGTIVDVIPFGKFAEPEESYDWGVDNSFRMNVQGFSEAFLSSITFLVNSF